MQAENAGYEAPVDARMEENKGEEEDDVDLAIRLLEEEKALADGIQLEEPD